MKRLLLIAVVGMGIVWMAGGAQAAKDRPGSKPTDANLITGEPKENDELGDVGGSIQFFGKEVVMQYEKRADGRIEARYSGSCDEVHHAVGVFSQKVRALKKVSFEEPSCESRNGHCFCCCPKGARPVHLRGQRGKELGHFLVCVS
jgi:hypothetical protein